jgi:hypothetical protein
LVSYITITELGDGPPLQYEEGLVFSMLLAFASYFISDCLWFAFFTSKRQKPSHHVKVACLAVTK